MADKAVQRTGGGPDRVDRAARAAAAAPQRLCMRVDGRAQQQQQRWQQRLQP